MACPAFATVLFSLLLLPPVAARTGPVTRDRAHTPRTVTVPFTLDHNRMIVEVELVLPDGTTRRARAWVDTGNRDLVLAEPLARDLGIPVSRPEGNDAGGSAVDAPPVLLGGRLLDLGGVPTRVRPGSQVMPGVPAEVQLPAGAFRGTDVVFDYPARRLTVASPGVSQPRGIAVPCRVNRETGLFLVDASIEGRTVSLGIDTGSAGTWASRLLVRSWLDRHPDWPQATGAVGSANFFGFDFETQGTLMRVPEIRLGRLRLRDVALLGLDQALFDWYSAKSAGPVVGFIGANVLRRYRVEVDLERSMTYWEPGGTSDPGDLDVVGLTLRPEADGSFTIAGVATRAGTPAVEGAQRGDTLVRIDGADVRHASMGTVVARLRGRPGAAHTLEVERGGATLTLEVPVTRFP